MTIKGPQMKHQIAMTSPLLPRAQEGQQGAFRGPPHPDNK